MNNAIKEAINLEYLRQKEHVELIASENFVSKDVLDAQGSIMTNKYAEGYPSRRYYGGCEHVDTVENIAKENLKKIFGAEHANVQPHCGSSANMAVYMSVLNYKDKILGMDLSSGGHLTHGHPLSFSGILYDFISYGVNKETEEIDYNEVREIALREKPKMIVAGASAYSKSIDFSKFKEIADEIGAYLMVDMAHIAGLVAGGMHQNPVPYADFVTSTTHKTLRGPRGGIILCKEKYAKDIDRAVFPGIQGGPLMHVIAAKAVCFDEALKPEFKDYAKQVVSNMQAMVNEFKVLGVRVIADGSDNHLALLDIYGSLGLTGKEAEAILGEVNITCNKNQIPFDTLKPMVTSGIRIGTAAMTTRGFKEEEFKKVAKYIVDALKNKNDKIKLEQIKEEIVKLTTPFHVVNN